MSAADASAIQSAFVAGWASRNPTVPVFYQNSPSQTPPTSSAWVRFSINPQTQDKTSFGRGTGRYEGRGRIEIQVFVPRGSGGAELDRLSDDAAAIFQDWQSNDGAVQAGRQIEFMAGYADETDPWAMRRISIPYLSRRLA